MRLASFGVMCCVVVVLLAGCMEQTALPSSSSATSTGTAGATSTTPQSAAAPNPSSDKVGTIAGRIMSVTNAHGRKPITGFAMYLGHILKSEKGVEGLVELDKGKAPSGKLDANGNFTIVDVPPGRYGLMLDTPQGPVLLNKPNGGTSMIIEIEGGKAISLGELDYPLDIG